MLTHFASDRISFDFVNQYQQTIARFQADLFGKLESICSMEEGCVVEKVKEYEKQNIPPDLGGWLVILPYLKDVMAILAIKEERHAEFVETGNLFVLVTSYFEIDWINSLLEKYTPTSVWEKIMRENLYRELETHQSSIVMKVLEFKRKDETMEQAFTNYMREKEVLEKEYRQTITSIKEEKSHNLMAVSVLINRLEVFV
jgi:NAD-specific glutamate dehydrogenase